MKEAIISKVWNEAEERDQVQVLLTGLTSGVDFKYFDSIREAEEWAKKNYPLHRIMVVEAE